MPVSSPVRRVSEGLDPLELALLSVCRDSREPLHALHAHAEDWLSRPLGSEEVEQALLAMARAGLVVAYRPVANGWVAVPAGDASEAGLRFLATPAGSEAAAAAWHLFFSE